MVCVAAVVCGVEKELGSGRQSQPACLSLVEPDAL